MEKRSLLSAQQLVAKILLLLDYKANQYQKLHLNTSIPENIQEYTFRYRIDAENYIEFISKQTVNVGGEEPDREKYWSDVCKAADIIFYMLDASKIISLQENDSSINRFKNDLRWMGRQMRFFKKNVKIAIIVNKIDLVIENNQTKIDHDIITNIAKSELEQHSNQIIGVYALSLTDTKLFHELFPTILENIATQ